MKKVELKIVKRIAKPVVKTDNRVVLKKDWWDNTIQKERIAIDEGLRDMKAGRVLPHSEAKKLYQKWL